MSTFDFGSTSGDLYISDNQKIDWTYDTNSTTADDGDDDDDGNWNIIDSGGTISTTSDNLKIDTDSSISIGPNMEKVEKLKEAAREQQEKLRELRDSIIDYLSGNSVGRREAEEAKSDMNKIEKMKSGLDKVLEEGDGFIVDYGMITEDDLLDTGEMKELNEIYRKWK